MDLLGARHALIEALAVEVAEMRRPFVPKHLRADGWADDEPVKPVISEDTLPEEEADAEVERLASMSDDTLRVEFDQVAYELRQQDKEMRQLQAHNARLRKQFELVLFGASDVLEPEEFDHKVMEASRSSGNGGGIELESESAQTKNKASNMWKSVRSQFRSGAHGGGTGGSDDESGKPQSRRLQKRVFGEELKLGALKLAHGNLQSPKAITRSASSDEIEGSEQDDIAPLAAPESADGGTAATDDQSEMLHNMRTRLKRGESLATLIEDMKPKDKRGNVSNPVQLDMPLVEFLRSVPIFQARRVCVSFPDVRSRWLPRPLALKLAVLIPYCFPCRLFLSSLFHRVPPQTSFVKSRDRARASRLTKGRRLLVSVTSWDW